MTARDGFDQLVRTWLGEEGAPVSVTYVDEILDRTSTTRQRPAWLSPGRWLPMQLTMTARRARVPAPVRYALLAILLIAVLAAVAILGGVGRRAVPPPFGPAGNGKIGFLADGSLVLASLDGTSRVPVTFGQDVASGPTFSRDGTRIAFYVRDPASALSALYVANADGTAAHPVSGDLRLTIDPSAFPIWSPDDRELVFPASHEGFEQLVVARSDGSKASILAPGISEGHSFPAWSPDGAWIAFAGESHTGPPTLQVVHPDGSGLGTVVTGGPGTTVIQDLEWAPDNSNRLLFVAGSDTESHLAIVDFDDGRLTTIVDRPGIVEFGEAWSPDAKRIASNQSDVGSIVVNADGSGLRVIPDARCAGRVLWSPDGTRLVCLNSVALGSGQDELLVVDVDGGTPPAHVPFQGVDPGQSGSVFSWQRLAE